MGWPEVTRDCVFYLSWAGGTVGCVYSLARVCEALAAAVTGRSS